MSMSLLQRALRPLLRSELPVRSLPTLLPARRWYKDNRADGIWEDITGGINQAFVMDNPEKRWADMIADVMKRSAVRPPSPFAGRTVKVMNGDIADATKKLDRILNENNVWRELRLTQRHEKKGAKRRRLSSERWRTRFKDEVRKKVELVKQIRRRGS